MKREFTPNSPVSLEEAVKAETASGHESASEIMSRNPKMVGKNVMTDDLYVYLIASPDGHIQEPYVIEKSSLDESDWHNHLSEKDWVDDAMLADFDNIQSEWLKKNKI